jgi:N-acyl homoserine lactone hydrolase
VLSITPLELGTLTVDRSTLTYMRGFGEPVDVPVVAWLLRDERRTWLVDTGAPPVAYTQARIARMRQRPEQTLPARLRAHGVEPRDVDTVIFTHVHFDHVGGHHELPAARFLVQRAELEYARAPLPVHARGYQHPDAGFPPAPWLDLDWEILDGDAPLAEDVRVLLTPGHTPGLQSVIVDTGAGPIAVASDNVPLHENWEGAPPAERHIPSGVHVDLRACYASFERLERTGAAVLPGHDPALFASGA